VDTQGTQYYGAMANSRMARPSYEGWNKSSPSKLAGSGRNLTASSASALAGGRRGRVSSGDSSRANNSSWMPNGMLPSQSASFGKAPIGSTAGRLKETERGGGKGYLPSNPGRGLENVPVETAAVKDAPNYPHGSLVPKPLAVGQTGREAMASVIYKPQAEYDPKNVV
jgi:hypothetical protein